MTVPVRPVFLLDLARIRSLVVPVVPTVAAGERKVYRIPCAHLLRTKPVLAISVFRLPLSLRGARYERRGNHVGWRGRGRLGSTLNPLRVPESSSG